MADTRLGGGGERRRHVVRIKHTGRDHARCRCGSALRDRQNRLAALNSEGNACAILTQMAPTVDGMTS